MINYESPLFIDIVLYTIYILLGLAVVATVVSAVRSLRMQGNEGGATHGVHTRRIALATLVLLVVTLAGTWLTGSTSPLSVNGETYSNPLWLRATDMLINTTLLLLAVAVAIAIGTAIYRATRKND